MAAKAPKATKGATAPATKAPPATHATDLQATPPEAQPAPVTAPAGAPEAERTPAQQPAARRAADNQLRSYIVGSVPIRHDDKVYGVGYDIELTAAQAERLGHLVAPIPTTRKE